MTISERAKKLAKKAAIAAAAAAAAWAAYVATHPDADIQRDAEREVTIAGEWYDASGTLHHGKRKIKVSELKAAIAAGIVKRSCGTVKERGVKCPDLYPPSKRCACCCPDGAPYIDGSDCRCATAPDCRQAPRSEWPECSLVDGKRVCDTTAVECGRGTLCRFGMMPGDPGPVACNPDAAGCIAWACGTDSGDDPGAVAAEVSE